MQLILKQLKHVKMPTLIQEFFYYTYCIDHKYDVEIYKISHD